MLTFIFIVLKLTGVIPVSWWWILLAIALDEEGGRKYLGTGREQMIEDAYSNLGEKYKHDYSESDILDIMEEYDYDIDKDTLEEELRNRL